MRVIAHTIRGSGGGNTVEGSLGGMMGRSEEGIREEEVDGGATLPLPPPPLPSFLSTLHCKTAAEWRMILL